MRWALAGLTAMLTLLAFQAGTAFASYDLQIYKAEKQVDLNSDDTTVKLSCNAGDYALDGMWRLDEVDQDNDSTFAEQMTSIDVLQAENEEAAGISSDEGTYDFRFVKNAIGRAQMKVFVTCLKPKVSGNGGHWSDFKFLDPGHTPGTVVNGPVDGVPTLVGPLDDFDQSTPATRDEACPDGWGRGVPRLARRGRDRPGAQRSAPAVGQDRRVDPVGPQQHRGPRQRQLVDVGVRGRQRRLDGPADRTPRCAACASR